MTWTEQNLTDILNAAYDIHCDLGPGLLETVYETVLSGQLTRMGFVVDRQLPIDIDYKGLHFPNAFRVDLFVNRTIIIEIKSVERLAPVHAKQVITYLKLKPAPVGLLINFGGALLKGNVKRFRND